MANIGNIVNFFVTWYDESDGYATSSDITGDVLGISFTDTGSGQVNECILKLSGAFGNFISNSGGPVISFTGGGGQGAAAEAVVSGGVITSITVTESGSGYTSVPTVGITGNGSGATATAVLTSEAVTSVTVNNGGTGYTTIPTVVDQYDRFRVQCEDLAGNSYDRFFEFNPLIVPSQTKTEGVLLELNLLGTEYHTQRVSFAGRFWFSDAFNVARAIGVSYNKNINSRQPILSEHALGYDQVSGVGNGFPKFTVNHYEYGLVEDSGYNRWNQMLDKLGGSVANGGVLDYFECGFETSAVNAIEVALFSQGSRTNDLSDDASLLTITQSLAVNIGSTDVGIAAATATQVAAWGSQTHGSLPTGHSIYASGVDQFIFRPLWDDQIKYLADSRVKYIDNKHYNALNDITGTPPFTNPAASADWDQIDMSDEFGDTIQYSEWTDDKVREWANCGVDPSNVTQLGEVVTSVGACMMDCNIVILDSTDGSKFFRTWADFIATSDATLTTAANNWAYSGATNQFPVGRRCFINGTGTGTFAGNDSNGIPFSNNIAEWIGEEWIVKYRPADTGLDLDNMQVVVIDDALIYNFDVGAGTWSIQSGDLATDCLHKYNTISSAESYDPKPAETDNTNHPDVTKDGSPFATNIFSSIKCSYSISQDYDDRTAAGSTTPLGDYFKKGAWIVWRIPFSPNNYGSSVTVGNVYGTDTPAVGEDNLEPSFLDTQNMSWTSRGKTGFNQLTSEDLGQLQEIVTNITVENKTIAGTKLDGITTVRCWMIDRYDNTVFYDVEIPFVDVSYPVKIPFSSFKIYRGKKPRYFDLALNNIASLVLPQELEIVNRFAFREIQIIGWQIQDFYDEFGRYAPDIVGDALDFNIDNTSLAKIFGGTLSLTIDDYHFTKPLLAIARLNTERNLEAEFRKRPHIISYKQLLNDAETELEKEQFQLKEYQIETAGSELFALKFGDGFFFENDSLVNNQDDSTDPSAKKIKLIVKHIQYNLTAPGTGEGGFTRTITSVKRFV